METSAVHNIKGYELRERIGAGGFGAVYRAYQTTVGREGYFQRKCEITQTGQKRTQIPRCNPLNGIFIQMKFKIAGLKCYLAVASFRDPNDHPRLFMYTILVISRLRMQYPVSGKYANELLRLLFEELVMAQIAPPQRNENSLTPAPLSQTERGLG